MSKSTSPSKRAGKPAEKAIRWNLQQASREYGVHRETLERRRRAKGMEPGEDGCYSTKQIAELIFGDNAAQAQLELTVARKEQIDLQNEVLRKERIPLDAVELVNDRVFSNVAGLLKAHVGKSLDEQLLGDIFAELRNMALALK